MARPIKAGLTYFPKDTGSFSDRKIRRLLNEFGAKGYAIFDCILCEIYSDKGYFTKYDDHFCFDLAYILGDGITETLTKEVVMGCLRIGLFNQGLFDKFSILTSSGIQKRYLIAKKKGVIADSLRVMEEETPENNPVMPIKKVNESKVNKSKGEVAPGVLLRPEEIEKLQMTLKSDYAWALQTLSNYKLQSGKVYDSDYHAICGWVTEKLNEKKNKENPKILAKASTPKPFKHT